VVGFDSCLIVKIWSAASTFAVLTSCFNITVHFNSDFFVLAQDVLACFGCFIGGSGAELRDAHEVVAASVGAAFTFAHLICFIAGVGLAEDGAGGLLFLFWSTGRSGRVGRSPSLRFRFCLFSLSSCIFIQLPSLVLV
jgi:hypothetical protein